MKTFVRRLNLLLASHHHRWYFMPAFGLLFLTLTTASIFALQYAKSKAPPPTVSQAQQPKTPTPTGQVAGFADIIDDSATSGFQEIGHPPPPTPPLTPTPTPAPTPTPFAKEEIYIDRPENNHIYDETDIPFKIEARVNTKVYKIEVIVNGVVKQSFTTKTIDTTIHLDPGVYMFVAKAYLADGTNLESTTLRFSTGGRSLDPTPAPTPTSTPTASPSASASPTPT